PSSPNTALFSLYSSRSHRHLHSFPTRRSSDLPNNEADYPWQIDNLAQAPTQLQELVDYARRFSITMRGAALTYNLLLARKSHQDELIETYTARLGEWRAELTASGVLESWDRPRRSEEHTSELQSRFDLV